MIEEILGLVVWMIANGVYFDMKRKGRTGFSRLAAFWVGFPMTLFWFFILPEGSQPEKLEPPDDAEELLAEIRREKERERISRGSQ